MKRLFVLLTLLSLTACSSIKGNWDYDPQTNFAQFKTYAWIVKAKDAEGYHRDGLMEQRIHQAVDSQLAAKGIALVDNKSADLLVNYFTKVDNKIDVDTFNSSFGYRPYYGPNWWWGGSTQTQTQVREYQVGTLFIDLVDNKTGKLVWRGAISELVRKAKSPQQKAQAVQKSITQLLSNFPPKPEAK
ncbi:MAG: DUF4136 domain-containing protein [Parashewanella sp.]